MKHKALYIGGLLLTAVSCSDEIMPGGLPGVASGEEIRLQAEIDQTNTTRANDGGFADGDRIGVFAVEFDAHGNPGKLEPAGNLANNVRFDFDEEAFRWIGERQLYFPDDKTPVDFYGYYPYDPSLDEVEQYPFSVAKNQNSQPSGGMPGGYEQSDLLWAKSAGVTPSSPTVNLIFKHILSSVRVSLLEGDGFGEGEWAEISKSVLVTNTVRNCTVDLSSGAVKTAGAADADPIAAAAYDDDFRAVVVPQEVAAGIELLTIVIDGKNYRYSRQTPTDFLPSKMHKFTMQVNKTAPAGDFEVKLIGESVTAWESDPLSHNGKVREYVVVESPMKGGLQNAVKEKGLNPEDIVNLKIIGNMNPDDFLFLRRECTYLEALNLRNVMLFDGEVYPRSLNEDDVIPFDACNGLKYLKYIEFPENLKKIGREAFRNTNLTGSLSFHEGLEYIGEAAFSNWQDYTDSKTNLSGTLSLPSTLKVIESSAFNNCDFTGPLVLPERLEKIGEGAFADCAQFSGELHLPHSLRELGGSAFSGTGFTGNFVIPKHLTTISNFVFPNVTAISWPDAPEEISGWAFWGTSLKGDLRIPESVRHIGEEAFTGTQISHLVFPQNLEFLERGVCSWCRFLQDTIVIPPLIETIGEEAFQYCDKLDAVVLPKRLREIRGSAFENCFSLTYIHCQATDPPVIEESAFHGVNKDNFTLEVPEGSVDAYRNAPGWSEFKRIAAYKNFVARPQKYNVLNKGGVREIILNADGEWTLVECPSWCHVSKSSGSMKTTLTLTVDKLERGQNPRSGQVTFELNDADRHRTHINVGQYDYEYDEDQCIKLQSATKGKGIDLFFVGDGYDAIDISSGLYLKDMEGEAEYLFDVEPYATYRDYFNVYTSFAMSDDSGVESLNRWRSTKFHTCIGDGTTRLSADWMGAADYCAATCNPIASKPNPAPGVILLANSDMMEGVCYMMGDAFCAVVTKSTADYPFDARGIVQHEAGGHGLGWLGDEYIYHQAFLSKCNCTDDCGHAAELQADHSRGFALNLSLTGRYKDVPWSHLIFHPSYSDIVDIYEGGYFHSRGAYRSEYNSCMNNDVPYYSTWSRQLIVQRIMHLAGEKFDLDAFYANDSRRTGRDFTGTTRGDVRFGAEVRHRGNPPVFIDNFKFGKKGGRK